MKRQTLHLKRLNHLILMIVFQRVKFRILIGNILWVYSKSLVTWNAGAMHFYSLIMLSPLVKDGIRCSLAATVAFWNISVSCSLARTGDFVDGDTFSEVVQEVRMFLLMPCNASHWLSFHVPLEFQLFLICDCCPREGVLGIPEMAPFFLYAIFLFIVTRVGSRERFCIHSPMCWFLPVLQDYYIHSPPPQRSILRLGQTFI